MLHLGRRTARNGPARTIDACFTSLAEDRGTDAIGVVLSGNGDDGTLGVAAIKKAGGLALAQDPRSAKFDSMPASAVATGAIDFVLPAEAIGVQLSRLAKLSPARRLARAEQHTTVRAKAARKDDPNADPLVAILDRLRTETGTDFDCYKRSMVRRRIVRRMGLRGIADFAAYAKVLRDNPDAVAELRQDLLIRVTGFFRDPQTFRALERDVLPALLKEHPRDRPFRVWVPGCASGEEAYSIAMCLLDAVDQQNLQVFATDVRQDAIEHARAGVYSAVAVKAVPAERRARFFERLEDGSFLVRKQIRDVCVFACHDLTRDPPFSRLDLISCRNVLIYLQPVLQRKLIRLFHYALNPRGCLVLGAAETAGSTELFAPYADKRRKIYRRSLNPPQQPPLRTLSMPYGADNHGGGREPAGLAEVKASTADLPQAADQIMLARYTPPSVLIDERFDVLQFRGDTSAYLEHRAGQASLALQKLVRLELTLELRTALRQARNRGAPARTGPVRMLRSGRSFDTSIEVVPIQLPRKQGAGFLVVFHDSPVVTEPVRSATGARRAAGQRLAEASRRAAQLELELSTAKTQLRATVEEQEATNEELRAAMEEVTSANEELQSINEELETAKEELQSTNEELTTINDELQLRNAELNQVNVDLQNLLASVDIPIIMLGRDLAIRRFTASAAPLFHLIASDVGRPIVDLRSSLDLADLDRALGDVIANGEPTHREVRGAGGVHSMWVRPYLTADGSCNGAVLTFFDISERRRAQDALQLYAERLRLLGEIDSAVLAGQSLAAVARLAVPRIRSFLAAAHVGVLLLDQQGAKASILLEDQDEESATGPTVAAFQDGSASLPLTTIEDLCLPDLAAVVERGPSLQQFWRKGMRSLLSVPLAVEGRVIGRLFAVARQPRAFTPEHVALARDVADHLAVAIEQARLYEQVRGARERLADLASHLVAAQEAERRRVAKELHDEVGQVLTGLKLSLATIATATPAVDVGASVAQVDRLIATVRAMSLDLRPTVLDDLGLLPALLTHHERFTAQTGVRVRMEHQGVDRRFSNEVETAAYRIVQEALTNVARHAGVDEAVVRVWGDAERLTVQVTDRGTGFDPPAVAAARSSSGLSGMSERAASLGGELSIDAAPGHGTRLLAILPLDSGTDQAAPA